MAVGDDGLEAAIREAILNGVRPDKAVDDARYAHRHRPSPASRHREGGNLLTERACRRLRRAAGGDDGDQGETEGLAERFGVSQRTIQRHLAGECNHTSSRANPRVGTRRCAVIREMALDQWSQREIGAFFDTHDSTVRHHAIGECSCDHTVPRVTYDDGEARPVGDGRRFVDGERFELEPRADARRRWCR